MLGPVLLAGCADHPPAATVPAGLAYSCAGEPAMIVYNGQGYLPGSSLRTPYSGADYRQAARARARLHFRGHDYDLVADDALEDLRYLAAEANDGRRLVWVSQAETAQLSEVDASGQESQVALCTRVRSPNGASEAVHPADADSPHRR